MSDAGACRCRGKSGSARVGEKVQHFYRTACAAYFFTEPVPVYRLFRKQSGVFEAEWFQPEGKFLIMYFPLLGKIKKFPFTAAFFAPVIMSVAVFPPAFSFRRVPDDLGIRTDQDIFSPALQLLPAGGVQDFVFFPVICNPHRCLPFIIK